MLRAIFTLLFLSIVQTSWANFIVVQSTTSTQNSGLYEYLLPLFEKESGIEVRVVAVGTGQALKNAENCDGDLLIVHASEAENTFVANGFGLRRHDLMYNDFLIIGPANAPTRITASQTIEEFLQAIYHMQKPFVSRGDDSGTHQKETSLWQLTGLKPQIASGEWYLEVGAGMGPAMNIAASLNAFILADRASWNTFQNKQNLEELYSGDPKLFNQYGIVEINPSHCPNVKTEEAKHLIDWLLGEVGQNAIASFRPNGQQLFFQSAKISD